MLSKIFDNVYVALLLVVYCCSSAAQDAAVTAPSEAKPVAKVIGGKTADSSAWPWMVGIVWKGNSVYQGQFCGGSLIAPDWVLTAAHCVMNETADGIFVVIDRPNLLLNDGESHNIARIVIHPEFDELNLTNDIALLRLTESSAIQPIQTLSDYSSQDEAGKTAVALGWGTTSAVLEQYPSELQEVELPIISNQACRQAMPGAEINEGSLCAGDQDGGEDTCSGDSGGPLVVFDSESQSWRQAGITSYGYEPCAYPGQYGVYTRLETYKDFITDSICTASQIPAMPSLSLFRTGASVTADWSTDADDAYRLYYAPYPGMEAIYSMDMTQADSLSVTLSSGQNFYVAVRAYNGNCTSDFSNVESFVIP